MTAAAAPAVPSVPRHVAVVGGGPAGLMAAETLAAHGVIVDVYDAMPSVGRKFLLAGRGGLNLTHAEPFERFAGRYGPRRDVLAPMLREFGADALRGWAASLGVATFVGSSGRVFPVDLKAAPLLRAWLHRLRGSGVRFHMRHRWRGWADGGAPTSLVFATPAGDVAVDADAVVLALGGGSWPRLGSDGAWVGLLRERGVDVAPLAPSNCGFDVETVGRDGLPRTGWSEHLRSRHAGAPLKNVALSFAPAESGGGGKGMARAVFAQAGEFVLTDGGVEGSLIYAVSALVRDEIARCGRAVVHIDLLPGRSIESVAAEVARPRGSRSLATHLQSRLGLFGAKAALLHELLPREVIADTARLAASIKALPLVLAAPRPLAEAISSAGGVRFEALDASLGARALPSVWCAGEMLDWEAPTGGYLLTACFASGCTAALGVLETLGARTVVDGQ